MLPTRYRAGLRRVQRRANEVLPARGARSAAGFDGYSGDPLPPGFAHRDRSDRHVSNAESGLAHEAAMDRSGADVGLRGTGTTARDVFLRRQPAPAASAAGHAAIRSSARRPAPVFEVHEAVLRELHENY